MKKKYFVIAFRRYKTAEEFKNKLVGHNHRNRRYVKSHSNIDWNKSERNIELTPLQFYSLEELREYAKTHLAKGRRNLKKGAAWGFEIIVDCTPDPNWTEQNYIEYLKNAEKWLRKRFDGQKVLSSIIHLDEGKPHLHIVFSYFNEKKGMWYQRRLKEKGIDRFPSLLDDFERDIGSSYGLYRGEGENIDKPLLKALLKESEVIEEKKGLFKTQKRRVISLAKVKRAIKRIKTKYKRALAENDHLYEELISTKREMNQLKAEFEKKENDLRNAMSFLRRELRKREERIQDILREKSSLEQRIDELEKENSSMKLENRKFRKKNEKTISGIRNDEIVR